MGRIFQCVSVDLMCALIVFVFKQQTAYELRISAWSSDVCSSDLFELTLHRMMTTPHLGDGPHPVVASAAREVLNKSDNERSGVLSTAMSFLGLYRDPTVAEVTSRCDWRIADLIAAGHPVSLRSEEHTSELQSLMRISYAVFCLKKKMNKTR